MPEGFTDLGWSTFSDCSGIETLVIPESLTIISYSAFAMCTGLTSLELHEDLIAIHDYAFRGCDGLESVVIPRKVTTLGYQCFESPRLSLPISRRNLRFAFESHFPSGTTTNDKRRNTRMFLLRRYDKFITPIILLV